MSGSEPEEVTDVLPVRSSVEWVVKAETVDCIKLHCVGLVFYKTTVRINDKTELIPSTSITQNPTKEMMKIKLPRELQKGQQGQLNFHYLAQTSTSQKMAGVYLTHDPSDSPTIATHFEPLRARSFLPCFDHPSLKARFKLTVMKKNIPEGFEILSNTCPEREDPEKIVFKETPAMCSYLLCLIISKLHWIESSIETRLRLRVYVPTSVDVEGARGCLALLQKSICFYEELFKQKLRLEKLDLVGLKALPPIAMENLGCLAFRLSYVLITEETPMSRVQRIARLVAHEVSHHWFGNSTSINSWKIIWLKEGFARYLEYLFTVYMFPSWDYWTDFAHSITDCAKQMDGISARTHPLEPSDLTTPAAITDSFDFITYNKGASIVRMLAQTVGWDVFSNGVNIFLDNCKEDCCTVSDFCQALQVACRGARIEPPITSSSIGISTTTIPDIESFDVEAWTLPWRSIPSHPVVFARAVQGGVALQQFMVPEPTRQLSFEIKPSPFPLPIVVVVCYPGNKRVTHTITLPPTETFNETFFPVPTSISAIVINPDMTSFCRCWYDATLFDLLLKTYPEQPSLTRLGLFLDCFSLLSLSSIQLQQQGRFPSWWKPRGHLGLEHQLYHLLTAFRDALETHNIVVHAAATAALDVLHRSQEESCEEGVRRTVGGYFKHLLPKIEEAAWQRGCSVAEGLEGFGKYDGGRDLSPAVAGVVLTCLGSAWDPDSIAFSRMIRDKLMEAMTVDDETEGPDLMVAVSALKVCVQHGGEKDWWNAWHLYTWALQPDELEQVDAASELNVDPWKLPWASAHPPVTLYGKVPQGYQLRAPLLECLAASPHSYIAQNVAKLSLKPSLSHDTSDIISLCTGILQNTALIDQVLLASSARVIWFLIKLAPSFGSPLWLARNESYWQNMGVPLKIIIKSNVEITRAIVQNLTVLLQ